MKPSRRDPLRELHQLVRVVEEGACNVGAFLAAHADELASVLGAPAEDLRASADMPDEVVVPGVRARLVRRRHMERQREDLEDAEVGVRAAAVLGSSVRWTEHGAVLDTDLLLGDLLADHAKRYVSFVGPDFTTTIARETLGRTASLCRVFIDLAAWVDGDGLHVRWRGGRGGYNWKPREVAGVDETRVLTVGLPPPVRAAVPRPGAWLGELLEEMGFAV